jgi:hypothetical protein
MNMNMNYHVEDVQDFALNTFQIHSAYPDLHGSLHSARWGKQQNTPNDFICVTIGPTAQQL